MHLIWTLLIGFIAGLVTKMLTPGRDPSGFFAAVIGANAATPQDAQDRIHHLAQGASPGLLVKARS
jgi:hypothetical protein